MSDPQVEAVVPKTLEFTWRHATQCSTRSMVRATGLNAMVFSPTCRAFGLPPHWAETLKRPPAPRAVAARPSRALHASSPASRDHRPMGGARPEDEESPETLACHRWSACRSHGATAPAGRPAQCRGAEMRESPAHRRALHRRSAVRLDQDRRRDARERRRDYVPHAGGPVVELMTRTRAYRRTLVAFDDQESFLPGNHPSRPACPDLRRLFIPRVPRFATPFRNRSAHMKFH